MTVISVTSASGSPGVTALALGLSLSFRRHGANPLLIEADPKGGALSLRFGLGGHPSTASLASEISRDLRQSLLNQHSFDLRGVSVVAAPPDPLVSTWALQRAAGAIAEVATAGGRHTVVDLGRLGQDSPALDLAVSSHVVLIVTKASVEDVQAMLFGIRQLRSVGASARLVVVGEEPYNPHEIAEVAGAPLAAVLPNDPVMARALVGGKVRERRFRRSVLSKAIDSLADSLLDAHRQTVTARSAPPPPPPPPAPGPERPLPAERSASGGGAPVTQRVSRPVPEIRGQRSEGAAR